MSLLIFWLEIANAVVWTTLVTCVLVSLRRDWKACGPKATFEPVTRAELERAYEDSVMASLSRGDHFDVLPAAGNEDGPA